MASRSLAIRRPRLAVLVALALAAGIGVIGYSLAAPIQEILPYEGYLTGPEGGPVQDGDYTFTLRLFDAAASGQGKELCTWKTIAGVRGGRFRVEIGGSDGTGTCAGLQSILANNPELWLEVTLKSGGSEETLLPRIPIRATARALHAQVAEQAGGSTGGLEKRLAAIEAQLVPTGTLGALQTQVATLQPVGAITAYFGSGAPAGWLVADGATIDKATRPEYAALVDHLRALGPAYQTGVATQAVLPDLRGRFALGEGAGPGLTSRTLGQTLGEESHALTAAEMPSHDHGGGNHSHSVSGGISVDHGGGVYWGPNSQGSWQAYGGSLGSSGGIIGSAGGDHAHNTVPPSLVVKYLIKL